ncbi:S-adenosyl-L-methionine-dependent methyltransferase [Cladochytrium replicatum]|nr:S-adenosyl-L-methionine-dependent methyltransferase [Cladochytrium replicatum]
MSSPLRNFRATGSIFGRRSAQSNENTVEVDKRAAESWTALAQYRPSIEAQLQRPGLRTFHGDRHSPYVFPDDVKEGMRLNKEHQLIRQAFNGFNFWSIPRTLLDSGVNVLDVGCGTGIWLSEIYQDFPRCQFYGVDITTSSWADVFRRLGANIRFTQGNVLVGLPFESNTFDYVHQQGLISGIPESKWPVVIAELTRVLKPGGYLDLVEMDPLPLVAPTPAADHFGNLAHQMFLARGVNFRVVYNLQQLVENDRNLSHTTLVRRTAPIGWDGKIGEAWKANLKDMYGGMLPFACQALRITSDEWSELVEAVLQDYSDGSSFTNMFRICARKSNY